MRLPVLLTAVLLATPALAQTAPPAAPGPRAYDTAPWWMDKPVLPSVGYVWTEVPANRGSVVANYQVVDDDVAAATKAAANKVRALGQALEAYGADKVRVETSFNINPLYAQYRDKQGGVNDNARADKIERYEVSARVSVEVRDVRLAERVYATLMAAKPSSTGQMSFRLEAENETRTQMSKLAVEDARRRATLAAEAAGARLGPVRLIDPSTRACQTDVLLAGAPRGYDNTTAYPSAPPPPPPAPGDINELVVTSAKRAKELGLDVEAIRMPIQPPLVRLESRACVIFGLG